MPDSSAACETAAAARPELGGGKATSASGLVSFEPQALCDSLLRGEGDVATCGEATARAVAEWWLAEAAAAAADAALVDAFPTGCALLERPTPASCRYRVAAAGGGAGLGETFRQLEAMKAGGATTEYSVGLTTLEQIFNQFASQQDNPEVG